MKESTEASESQPCEGIGSWARNPRVIKNAVALIIFVSGALIIFQMTIHAFAHSLSINCLNTLKKISVAAKLHAYNEQTDRLPTTLLLLTNVLSPRDLRCRADGTRAEASTWPALQEINISYVIDSAGAFLESTNTYARCTHHGFTVSGSGRVSHVYKEFSGKIVPNSR